MDTLRLTLPEGMKTWLAQEAARAGLATPADFVVELLRQEQERVADEAALEQELLKGINSGPPVPVTEADWEARKRRLAERLAAERRDAV
jgi:hypothetical protein